MRQMVVDKAGAVSRAVPPRRREVGVEAWSPTSLRGHWRCRAGNAGSALSSSLAITHCVSETSIARSLPYTRAW